MLDSYAQIPISTMEPPSYFKDILLDKSLELKLISCLLLSAQSNSKSSIKINRTALAFKGFRK